MSWRRRWRAWLRSKLHELKVRSRGALSGWKDPQPVLCPPWRPSLLDGAIWNYDIGFQKNESVLGVFITVRNEVFHDHPYTAAAIIANTAEELAHEAAREEANRRAAT